MVGHQRRRDLALRRGLTVSSTCRTAAGGLGGFAPDAMGQPDAAAAPSSNLTLLANGAEVLAHAKAAVRSLSVGLSLRKPQLGEMIGPCWLYTVGRQHAEARAPPS